MAIAATSGSSFAASSSLNSIEQLRWSNRLILIHGWPYEQSAHKIFQPFSAQFADRHILWFVFEDSANGMKVAETNYTGQLGPQFAKLTKPYQFTSGDHLLLIGKDGGVKLRQKDIEMNQIFDLIDTMPMRQSEIAQAKMTKVNQ